MYSFTQTGTSESEINDYSVLLGSVFPTASSKLTPEYVAWQYSKNPLGKVIGFDARFQNELIAHYVTLPVEYWLEGQKSKGLLSLNTATAASHQGKGLFKKLAEFTYEKAASLGYDFIIGVANQNSTHGFTKKLGFNLIAPLDARIGFGFAHDRDSPQPETLSLLPHHSKEWLTWRLGNPSQSYHYRSKQIVAHTKIPGLAAIMTMREENSSKEAILPARLTPSFYPLSLWIGIEPKRSGRDFSFPIPMKLRPSPLNLIFKSLNNKSPALDRKSLRFELIDFDAY